MDATDMINRCYRRQHPEAFAVAHDEIREPSLPNELMGRYGDTINPTSEEGVVPEEEMGNGEVIP